MFETTTIETALGTCSVKWSGRKTLGISVLPNGSIELAAPKDCSTETILEKIKKRRRWILRQRNAFTAMNVCRPPLRYCSGATHRYLGRQYRLKIQQADSERVKLKGAYFEVETNQSNERHIEKLIESWMRTRAEIQFERRIQAWKTWCQQRNLPTPKLEIRKMAKRWGSAHQSGKIILNPDLIRTPSVCIDYVIAHEICHLQQPYHDSKFYRQLDEVMPFWKSVKLRLEQAEF